MASDLEVPNDSRSGFFAADLRAIPAQAMTRWVSPGDWYYRVRARTNADGSLPTGQELTNAEAAWEALTQEQRWRLRIHHDRPFGSIRWKHATLEIYVYFVTFVPTSKAAGLKALLTPGEFEFLGETYSEAKAKVVARTSLAFWLNIFPEDRMENIIYGFEWAMV